MTEPVRLSKTVVALTGCSRREAQLYIEGGWVLVDGQVVEEPQFMVAGHTVTLAPGARPDPVAPVTLILHKPEACDSSEGERRAALLLVPQSRVSEPTEPPMRVLRGHFARLSVPMPLPRDASGLLVLTQDWQVARKLTEDASRIEQEYTAQVSGTIADSGLEQLNRGITANGWKLPSCKVSWQSEQRLRFAGKDLRAPHIVQLCESVGLQVTQVRRVRIGQVALSGLQPGQWRYLQQNKRF